jgi:hypothetical protein
VHVKNLSISLGKLNYYIKALKSKSQLKLKILTNKDKKIQYFIYVTTLKSISTRVRFILNFMKKSMIN